MKLFVVYNLNLDISALSIIPINNEPLVIMSPFNLKNNTEFYPLHILVIREIVKTVKRAVTPPKMKISKNKKIPS